MAGAGQPLYYIRGSIVLNTVFPTPHLSNPGPFTMPYSDEAAQKTFPKSFRRLQVLVFDPWIAGFDPVDSNRFCCAYTWALSFGWFSISREWMYTIKSGERIIGAYSELFQAI